MHDWGFKPMIPLENNIVYLFKNKRKAWKTKLIAT